MHIAHLLTLPALLGVLHAQAIVIPTLRAATDGSSGGALAGVEQRFRMQVLLDATALGPVAGHMVTTLAFRRDGQHRAAWQGGRVNLTVRLSTTTRTSAAAEPLFGNNHGSNVRDVFSGQILVPDAPVLATRDGASWSAPDAVVIGLSSPFAYAGGTLCVELEGTPVALAASPWWRIDHELYGHDARVDSIGASCDPYSTAFASRNTLLPGGALDLVCTGPRDATAVLILGLTPLTPALDLRFLGAAGCYAGIVPASTVATLVNSGPALGAAAANLTLPLPAAPWLAGGRIFGQWAVFPNPRNAALLTTTNVLDMNLASAPSPLPGALVRTGPLTATEPWPASGRVYPQLLPVIRIEYQ